jgi:hypothetical protein
VTDPGSLAGEGGEVRITEHAGCDDDDDDDDEDESRAATTTTPAAAAPVAVVAEAHFTG